MKRRTKAALFSALVFLSCSYCALLWLKYNTRNLQLERLQQEISRLSDVSAQGEALQKTYAQLEELERLRRNHFELGELTAKVAALRRAQAQRNVSAQQAAVEEFRKLKLENAELRAELDRLKASPGSIEARRSVDGSELEQIGHFFRAYARNNNGKYPTDFAELKYYLPATVYPSIETNRFEILNSEAANTEPSQQPLVRTRLQGSQDFLLYLFADGHLESKRAFEH
jgi:hypothetical protein